MLEASAWSSGDATGGAVGALASAGRGIAAGGIWLGIFSPFWIAGMAVAYGLWRRGKLIGA